MRDVYDMMVIRDMGGGMCDRMVVLRKLKIVGEWLKKRVVHYIESRVRNERFSSQKEGEEHMRFLEKNDKDLRMEWKIEKMWGKFKVVVVSSASVALQKLGGE